MQRAQTQIQFISLTWHNGNFYLYSTTERAQSIRRKNIKKNRKVKTINLKKFMFGESEKKKTKRRGKFGQKKFWMMEWRIFE